MNPEETTNGCPNPFPEPRTIPDGWDISALAAGRAACVDSQPSGAINITGWLTDPSCEPRTIPSGWDLAALK
ncbi:MAG: hypothetical protein JXB85_13890 [Anaerolineales bacterium]|nr:hypothetical protein [Anaerolineales bacterium]